MPADHNLDTILANWADVLGDNRTILSQYPERELWLVRAENTCEYYLKRLGPWRNLPLASEARVLQFIASESVNVAEFIPTDTAKLYAGKMEDSFILMARLESDNFSAREILEAEADIGQLIARLHIALAKYPWRVNSYTENLQGSLERELVLPANLAKSFSTRRTEMISVLAELPMQLVHGDLTPENIVLQRTVSASGFIDFEHLPIAPRIWDVAKYLSRRFRMRWRAQDNSSHHQRLDHIAPLLRGYHQVNPLCSQEIAALPAMVAAANVIEVNYFMEIAAGTLVRRKLSDHNEVLADSIEAAQWHLTHWSDVEAAVHSIARSI